MPVEDHEIHHSVINTGQPYGCINRHDFNMICTGGACYGSQHWEFQNSHDCMYDMSETDSRCEGCFRVGHGRINDENIRKNGS